MSLLLLAIVIAVVGLAYANGANDNFKGVATLFGSGSVNYRGALTWATVTTLLGSVTAVFLAGQLLNNFSGKGLIADALTADASFVAAVAAGAAGTVLLATRLGMPVSTTHGLVGALVGAGWAAGSAINLVQLRDNFFVPLLISPLVAVAVTVLVYPLLRFTRRAMGVTYDTCFCVGKEVIESATQLGPAAVLQRAEQLSLSTGTSVACSSRYHGRVLGIEVSTVVDGLHFLSAGVVSFARGLNDTPKIAALLLVGPLWGQWGAIALVGLAIALGGILSARRVAETMSQKITPMNPGQGFTANLITGVIVIGASRWGLPVSTTHVSCGALFGIGAVTRQGSGGMILRILTAWVTTLPLGAALGASCFWLVKWVA